MDARGIAGNGLRPERLLEESPRSNIDGLLGPGPGCVLMFVPLSSLFFRFVLCQLCVCGAGRLTQHLEAHQSGPPMSARLVSEEI